TAWRSGSIADQMLFSRPRPQMLPVGAAPAPIPAVWTNLRRDNVMAPPYCPFPDEVVVEDLSTLRNTSGAFCLSSIVPSEMRAHCFSSGGKSRPTITPLAAHPSRNAAAVIVLPISVKMKLVCESVDV